MMTYKILVETAPGQTRLAFCDAAGDIQDLWHYRHDQPDLIGSVHLARIEQVFAAQNRARARLADDTLVSLRLRKNDDIAATVVTGAVVAVTISAAPRHGKAWQAVLGARLISAAMVLLPGQTGVHFSHHIEASAKARLAASSADLSLAGEFGVILRRGAATLDRDQLQAALADLIARWRSGAAEYDSTKPAILHDGGTIKERAGRAVMAPTFCDCQPGSPESEMIDAAIVAALDHQVPLVGGAALWCQRTHALWAIDIDGGTADINRHGFDNVLDAAAVETARQMRLRGMSGPIMVDVPSAGAAAKKFRKDLQLRLDSGPQSPDMLGLTRGGMLELWRPHGRMALVDVMADHAAQAALAGLRLAAARPPFKPVQLAVNAAMAQWLNGPGKQAVDDLQRPLDLVVCVDDAPLAAAYIIDRA